MAGMCYWPSFDSGGPGLSSIPAPCSSAGPVTKAVMWVASGGTMRIGVSTQPSDPYFISPNARFEFSDSDGVVEVSFYDPGIYGPWDGPSPLNVVQGQPLYIEPDGYGGDPFFFALLIAGAGGPPGEITASSGPSGVVRVGQRKR